MTPYTIVLAARPDVSVCPVAVLRAYCHCTASGVRTIRCLSETVSNISPSRAFSGQRVARPALTTPVSPATAFALEEHLLAPSSGCRSSSCAWPAAALVGASRLALRTAADLDPPGLTTVRLAFLTPAHAVSDPAA